MRTPVSAEDQVWVAALIEQIWSKHKRTRNSYACSTEKRKLSLDEYNRLVKLVREHELPCNPGSGVFGFGFSLCIYNHAILPGVPPEALIAVSGEHLPFETTDHGWATFEAFTHTAENRQLLEYYGFPAPRNKAYYDY